MGLSCPFCQHEGTPAVEKKVSSAGWILFAVLLLFCFPICWLPLVIDPCKDEFRKCTACGKTWK